MVNRKKTSEKRAQYDGGDDEGRGGYGWRVEKDIVRLP